MKKKIIITSIALLTFAIALMSSNSGGSGSASAGCSCHGTPSASTLITMTGVPASGYVPGTAYSITLSATNTNYASIIAAKAGFTLLFSAGTLSNAPTQTIISGTEIRHTSGKSLTSGSVSWTFTWTAPATGTGAVSANIAVNMTNGNGQTSGDAHNIATLTLLEAVSSALPTITNVASSAITTNSATVSANVNANNASTTISVEYGLTTSYGSTMATTPGTASGSAATAVSASLSSLTANTTYNYRVKAVNSVGTSYSPNFTFTTNAATAAPSISNVTSSAITTNSATIGANVIANNAATTISVEYGLTTAYGSTMSTTPSTASGSAATAVSASLSSLTANTTYNYRVKAVNSIGTTYSNNYTFQTNSATTIVLLEDNGMVYPNPSANGKFILKTAGSSTIDKLNVFNATGALTPLIHIDQNKMEIDLSNEAAGLYYLSFELNGKRMIAKLIIEK